MLGRNLIFALSGVFLRLIPKFGATSKNYNLLTAGDLDINSVPLEYTLLNTEIYEKENKWSLVNFFHGVQELLHFTFTVPLNLVRKF